MALDSEQKRWSMLRVANGVPPSIVFNPDGSNADSVVERLTVLGYYGGFGASAPVFAGPIPDIEEASGSGAQVYDLSGYFTGATSYSISPAVETGWNFDTSTGILTILTDETGSFGPYTVTGTNAQGSDNSNAFDVTITDQDVGGGSYGKKPHGGYIPRPRYEKPVDIQPDLGDDELAAIAIFVIQEFYD